jgi:trehalose utilization protein
MENPHIHLVRRIFPDHMHDCIAAARVVGKPGIGLDDMLVQDEDGPALGDQGLDLAA